MGDDNDNKILGGGDAGDNSGQSIGGLNLGGSGIGGWGDNGSDGLADYNADHGTEDAERAAAQGGPQPNILHQYMGYKVNLDNNANLPGDAFGPHYGAIKTPVGWTTPSYSSQSGSEGHGGHEPGPGTGGVPPLPPGVDIGKNVDEAHKYGGLYWLYTKVRNKGPWDYKQIDKDLYQNGGNFHYGVVAEAAGVPDWLIMRAPGLAQIIAGTSAPEFGKPWGNPPYGDDPVDQYWIQKGREYYNQHYRDLGRDTGWRNIIERRLGRMN